MDIKNEPRPATVGGRELKPTWGTGGQTDFAAMYTSVGNLIHQINPHPLIICEGLNYACDLTGVASHPVRLTEPNKVVYSMHDYSWSGHGPGQTQAAYIAQMTTNGGYLSPRGRPRCGSASSATPPARCRPRDAGAWWANIQAWLKEYDVDWCWWALNPTHGQSQHPGDQPDTEQWGAPEPYGLLTPDWSGVGFPAVMTMLKAIM